MKRSICGPQSKNRSAAGAGTHGRVNLSFFAPLRHPEDGSFRVAHCHLNVWVLPALFGRHRLLFDLGLRVVATDPSGFQKFQVALPFCTIDNAFRDLKVNFLSSLDLIFGKPVAVADGQVDYGSGPTTVLEVPQQSAQRLLAEPGDSFSVWSLSLSDRLKAGDAAYVRFRFSVARPGRMLEWKRFLFWKNGIRVDLRLSDVREAWNITDSGSYIRRVQPVDKLYAFLVVPGWVEPTVVQPAPEYIRLLEGRAWQKYLGRRTGLASPARLAIIQWRGSDIDADGRFQGYLDGRRSDGLLAISNHLLIALFVIVGIGLYEAAANSTWVASFGSRLVEQLAAHAGRILAVVGITTVAALIAAIPKVRRVAGKTRSLLQRCEDWLYSLKL